MTDKKIFLVLGIPDYAKKGDSVILELKECVELAPELEEKISTEINNDFSDLEDSEGEEYCPDVEEITKKVFQKLKESVSNECLANSSERRNSVSDKKCQD